MLDPVPAIAGREAYRPVPAAVPGYGNGSGTAQHAIDGLVTLGEAPDVLPVTPAPSAFEWRGTGDIFATLPPVQWISKDLQLCAGRPALLAGYGSSAKTLSAQALALAVASGTLAWGRYPCAAMRVRHLDYEQGWRATARRYQRLAIGHRIDPEQLAGRLEVAVFPRVYLDSPEAVDAYSAACEGTGLVILDALRGAAPRSDENDSSIRAVLDNLSRVSERTGTMFLVLHHAGKMKDGHSDSRQRLRGSSAIFDAAGCVFLLSAGATPNDPRKLEQVKPPAEAEGRALEPVELVVEDVLYDGDPNAGVAVRAQDLTPEDERTINAGLASLERDFERLLKVVRRSPGVVSGRAITEAGLGRNRGFQLVELLESEGRLRVEVAERGARKLWAHVEGP